MQFVLKFHLRNNSLHSPRQAKSIFKQIRQPNKMQLNYTSKKMFGTALKVYLVGWA